MEGINDIGQGRANPLRSAADLIAAHRQLILRAHARGLKIIGATLTPFEGAGYWTTPEGEAKRVALNEWIRTSREYDGIIDSDAATRDPSQPTKVSRSIQFRGQPSPQRCWVSGDGKRDRSVVVRHEEHGRQRPLRSRT